MGQDAHFAVAYRLTGDPGFLAAADRFLGSWMSVYHASFNPIDETNLDKVMFTFDLTRGELKPATEAEKTTLIRRVTLDLTGLPPTPEEVDAFPSDERPDAYERLVDRLLNHVLKVQAARVDEVRRRVTLYREESV